MNLLSGEYLSPTNPIASGIVMLLQFLFFLWFVGLIGYWFWLFTKQRQICKNEDVQSLVDARQEQDSQLEENEQKEKADSIFRKFCISRSLRESSPVAKHLKAIFRAGWFESRLEAGELINHTTSDLLKWNGLLRSVLAIFIIIGLLGTLFGLTDSLMELAPALKESSTDTASSENSEQMTQALSLLLTEMKGALAPSIWGIIFTVLGVIFYSLYLGLACHPVKSTLERLTLTVWVPQLYPTTSQKLIQTLHESEAQMRKGYETATQVGELVGTVQDNISKFNKNLDRANDITQPLSNSVSQINNAADVLNETFAQELSKFSQQFTKDVTHLTGFQDELRNLHQTFQEGAQKTLDALKDYEASRQETDERLQQFINEATEGNKSINAKNRKLLEGIPNQLDTKLTELTNQLTEKLDRLNKDLVNQFHSVVSKPLADTASDIRTIVLSFDENVRTSIRDLQHEFQKQNKNNKAQLDALTKLAKQEDINTLTRSIQSLTSDSGTLNTLIASIQSLTSDSGALNALTHSIQSLTSDSGTLSKSIGAIEEHVEALGTASGKIEEHFETLVDKADVTPLTEGIGQLRKSIDAISENSQALADATQRLARQVSSPHRDSSKRTNRTRIWERISKPFRRKSSRT